MDDSILSLEIENLRELLRLKRLNDRLLDANYNLLSRLVQKGNSLDAETEGLLAEVRHVLKEIALSPVVKHDLKYPGDEAMPDVD